MEKSTHEITCKANGSIQKIERQKGNKAAERYAFFLTFCEIYIYIRNDLRNVGWRVESTSLVALTSSLLSVLATKARSFSYNNRFRSVPWPKGTMYRWRWYAMISFKNWCYYPSRRLSFFQPWLPPFRQDRLNIEQDLSLRRLSSNSLLRDAF